MRTRPAALTALASAGLGVLTAVAPVTSAATEPGPALAVDVTAGRHPLSDDVYGISFPSDELLEVTGATVGRWGGNTTSRYNFTNGTHNTGSDYFYENIVNPTEGRVDAFVDRTGARGAESLVTVPLLGWVSKDSPAQHPFACGFRVSVHGPQEHVDPYDPDCGNGVRTTGGPVTGNDPRDTSIPAGPGFVRAMVEHLVHRHGSAAEGGVASYSLDNEPHLWDDAHRDVHPHPVTYDELWARSRDGAAAVKSADPTAAVTGPGDWGWCAYFFSPADASGCGDGADRQAHDGVPLTAWYLRQFAAHERATGQRLLDVLDQHFYPQSGIAFAPAGDAAQQALRLRQTRTLWDPTYRDESWTAELGLGPVRLLPRLREWVEQEYPGTGVGVSEYNFGGLESMNGALAQADVLGILGREGATSASLWGAPEPDQPGAQAFAVYRDYDGRGARFGDTSVRAVSDDQGRLAVYAAERSSDGALTLVVVNKAGVDLASTVDVSGRPEGVAQAYRYSPADPSRIVRVADADLRSGPVDFPADSITVLELPLHVEPAPTGSAACPGGEVPEDGFTDVLAGTVHEAAVDCLVWWGVAQGTAPGRYSPARDVTRAQLATFVVQLLDASEAPLPPASRDAFRDDDGSVHEDSIDRLAAAGIVGGRADGGYGPDLPVTRAAMASFLVRALEHVLGEPLPPAPDAFRDDDGDVHERSIDKVAATGITVGSGDGRYLPGRAVTREQMASFVVRTLDVVVERGRAAPPP